MAITEACIDVGAPSSSASRHALPISRSMEDYPSASASSVWNLQEGSDRFRIGDDRWIVRPPAAELKLVLEELSPGLDGWPLQRLNVLAQELMACGNQEDPMVGMCLEMRGLLEDVFEALAHELHPCANQEEGSMVGVCQQMLQEDEKHPGRLELADAMQGTGSCTVLKLLWAFTWVETLLLEHDMLRARGSDVTVMQTIRDRWNKLHLCWPPGLKRTKRALDFHRRSALLSCGQEREAVQHFEAPDFYKGFEACFLCFETSCMHYHGVREPGRLSYGYSWRQLEDKFLCWVERAATAGPQHHQHWPLVRLHVLMMQVKYLRSVRRMELADEVLCNALAEFQQIDLQLRFDFPVPLPKIQSLKLRLLSFFANDCGRSWQPQELVPGIGPEVLDSLDVVQSSEQAHYAYACVVLRGQQLIAHFGQLEEGLQAFHTCLAKSGFSRMKWWILGVCETTIWRVRDSLESLESLHRANRIQAFLVAHGISLDFGLLTQMFMRNWVATVSRFSTHADVTLFQGEQQGFKDSPDFDPCSKAALEAVEALWESYKDSCAALSQAGATECRYEVRHMDRGQELQAFAGSWIPSFHLFHLHAIAATLSRFLPFAVVPHGEIARQALLCLETARNYRHEGFGPNINWERIQRAHQACGPGAVFVQFAGLGFFAPQYGRSLDGWPHDAPRCEVIVVQDEGVASFHTLIDCVPENVHENVREISNACLDRKLETDSCRNALETLYDLLIRPLFQELIHQGKEWKRHRKLVISAVGFCKDVPFSILRNRDSGCYLFEEAQLAFTPSFLMLDHCQLRYELLQQRTLLAGAGAAVAVGDPHYLPYQHIPLPGSRKEVDAICRLFDFCHPEHEIVKLLGGDATVEKVLELVKKPSTGVESGTAQCSQAFIHMAAHGSGGKETDHGTLSLASAATTRARRRGRAAKGNVTRDDEESDEEPEAPDSSDDVHAAFFGHQIMSEQHEASESGTAAEGLDFLPRLLRSLRKSDAGTSLQCDDILLSRSEWSAYMVVLSACNTAVGVALNSNVLDVLSFSRAFMTAGVPCSILAQWAVDDSAAVQLMPWFYEALSQGEDACSALQSAMIKMRQSGKYTLHQIAPFVVTGLPTVCLPPQMQQRRCPA